MPLFLDTRGRRTLGIGICARCSIKMSLEDLYPDPNSPGLRVCRDDLDNFDPWRLSPRNADQITLEYPRPDIPLWPIPDKPAQGYGLYNDGGVCTLTLGVPNTWPTDNAGLFAGALWSNGGVVSIVAGLAPTPHAPPLYFYDIVSATTLLALGGAGLPTTPPIPGTQILWTFGGEVWIA